MQHRHVRALKWGLGACVLGAVLHALGLSLPIVMLLCLVVFVLTAWTPRVAVELLDHLVHQIRERYWREDEGRYHTHRGRALHIEDDGRHVWVSGNDLQGQLGSRDSETVLCARHAGRWRRDDEGRLMLRVDAVVQHLATMPGRADPSVVRLRRYFEREVLFPAQERRRRSVRSSP